MFVDMHQHTPLFWAKFLFVALTLLLWGGSLLPITYLTMHALFTSTWDWYYLIIAPTAFFALIIMWVTYGIVLDRFNAWLRDNGLRGLWGNP
jgi:hypothetical protein